MASYNKKEHLRANIDAIQTVFTIHREHRTATEEEMKVLRAYTGFGALKCILSPANSMEDIARWNKSEVELFPLVMELHRVIRDNTASESQYKSYMQSLKKSVMTAFYTPEPIVREIAASLQEAGITSGKILDPSAGMGEFIRSFNPITAEGYTTFGFEKDILTGQLLSALHPDDKIRIRGFEEIESKFEGYFDVVSSNIPFGDIAVFDPVFSKTDEPARKVARMSLHNYFFIKSVDMLREGGVLAFITSQGVMNAPSNEPVREWLMSHTRLVSAVRLPNNLFAYRVEAGHRSLRETCHPVPPQRRGGRHCHRYGQNPAGRFGKAVRPLIIPTTYPHTATARSYSSCSFRGKTDRAKAFVF